MRRGFTLVELMVIVAIIGLFTAIGLTSMSGSKNKGNDAAVKQNMRALQQQAELYSLYNANTYNTGAASDACSNVANSMFDPSQTAIVRELAAIDKVNGAPTDNVTCRSSRAAYAVSSPLPGGTHWCVDSTGFSGSIPTALDPGDHSCR